MILPYYGLLGFGTNVLLIEAKLHSSNFVRDAFVVQVNPIIFVACDRNLFRMPQPDWLDLNYLCGTGGKMNYIIGFNNQDTVAMEIQEFGDLKDRVPYPWLFQDKNLKFQTSNKFY